MLEVVKDGTLGEKIILLAPSHLLVEDNHLIIDVDSLVEDNKSF